MEQEEITVNPTLRGDSEGLALWEAVPVAQPPKTRAQKKQCGLSNRLG